MNSKTVRLGFEIGTGTPVDIPIRHTAVTGVTQEAGKTTALEALITRAGLQAVTFVTKRGEGSFAGARRIDPYFREQADWQFVASILEASRGEKLRFERAWIIRASKGARTLAEVHNNVRKAMESVKGLSADVYLTLDAYLEVVVPQIGRTHWASTVRLQAGVNAMDLTGMPVEMQHLVIKSTLDWVLQNGKDTVVVVPEAWKFIPQGRGTPVKLAAEGFIRQGAALRNYLWLDSQDIAGIDKIILKSVPLWILGVQREANEIKRTLSNIPAGVKQPKPADIAHLGLGEFFACWGRHCVKTYVQPVWMSDVAAINVAAGHMPVPPQPLQKYVEKENTVTKEEADALRAENADLKQKIADLQRQISHLPAPLKSLESAAPAMPAALAGPLVLDDALYQEIKGRLAKEAPGILKLLTVKPEIEVTVERKTINLDETKPIGRVAKLIAEGFFDSPISPNAAHVELQRLGKGTSKPNVYTICDNLAAMGFLTKEASGYQAVEGMKVNIVEG